MSGDTLAGLAVVIIVCIGIFAVFDICTRHCQDDVTTVVTEKDGCKLYAYYKKCYSSPIYFTNCSGSTQWTVPAGKATRQESVQGGGQ